MKKVYFLILIVILCTSCNKDDVKVTSFNGVITTSVTNITNTSALCKGYVIMQDNLSSIDNIKEYGFCYSTESDPRIGKSGTDTIPNAYISIDTINKGRKYTANLTNLKAGTKYYVRTYIKAKIETKVETFYGDIFDFKTKEEEPSFIATVSTFNADNITDTSATCIGTVQIKKGNIDVIKVFGFCYATHPKPTTEDSTITIVSKDTINPNLVKYMAKLEKLNFFTTYYARAYIELANGEIFYGDEISFTTFPEGYSKLIRTRQQYIKVSKNNKTQ